VRKTSLVIDDDLIRRAGEILGTRGIKETIDRALEEVVVMNARREIIRRLQTMDGLDLDNPEVMRSAWRDQPEFLIS
jgi:Arc/MetJ family transcription regulator